MAECSLKGSRAQRLSSLQDRANGGDCLHRNRILAWRKKAHSRPEFERRVREAIAGFTVFTQLTSYDTLIRQSLEKYRQRSLRNTALRQFLLFEM